MKHCPACQNRYTDETLNFCLEDGTPLVDETAKQSSIGTVAFKSALVDQARQSSIDTTPVSDSLGSVSHPPFGDNTLRTEHLNLNAPNDADKTQSLKEISNNPPAARKETRKSNFLSFALPAGLLLFFVFGGIGIWFYLADQNKSSEQDSVVDSFLPENKQNASLADQSMVGEKQALEKPEPEPTAAGRELIRKEITAAVENWNRLAEARDLIGISSLYAETVDFYGKNGAKLAEVRSEIQKTFTTYDRINITLTDIKISVNADGDKATAVFDREWDYENSKDLSEGKAHTRLHFQKKRQRMENYRRKTSKDLLSGKLIAETAETEGKMTSELKLRFRVCRHYSERIPLSLFARFLTFLTQSFTLNIKF